MFVIYYTVRGDFCEPNDHFSVGFIAVALRLWDCGEQGDNGSINHDDNGDYTFSGHGGSNKKDEIINDEEWCDIAFSNLPKGFVIDKNNPKNKTFFIIIRYFKVSIMNHFPCDISLACFYKQNKNSRIW